MKRRKFIISAAVVSIGVSATYYLEKYKWTYDPLSMPDLLGRFCEEKIIKEIGVKYRHLVPAENEKKKLVDMILTDENGKKTKRSDKMLLLEAIDKKIHDGFVSSDIIIIDGWVITKTEARQCAIFSLL